MFSWGKKLGGRKKLWEGKGEALSYRVNGFRQFKF